jgi:hypothetical protein
VSEALLQTQEALLPESGLPLMRHGLGHPPWEEHTVQFGSRVVLTKEEAFGACQALADAGRVLVRSGGSVEADLLCSLFTLIEDRLVTR